MQIEIIFRSYLSHLRWLVRWWWDGRWWVRWLVRWKRKYGIRLSIYINHHISSFNLIEFGGWYEREIMMLIMTSNIVWDWVQGTVIWMCLLFYCDDGKMINNISVSQSYMINNNLSHNLPSHHLISTISSSHLISTN